MTRLPLMALVGAAAAAGGLAVLVRPAGPRRLLGVADTPAAAYALRIAGAMAFALGLFLGGFALALSLTR